MKNVYQFCIGFLLMINFSLRVDAQCVNSTIGEYTTSPCNFSFQSYSFTLYPVFSNPKPTSITFTFTLNGVSQTRTLSPVGINSGQAVQYTIAGPCNATVEGSVSTTSSDGTVCPTLPIDFNAPLPIVLSKFDTEVNEKMNLISWETSSELNSGYFILERSYNSFDWKSIAYIQAAGISNEIKRYQFEDKTVKGNAYYYLRQIDNDQSQTISEIRFVERNSFKSDLLTAYPNPVSSTLKIDLGKLDVFNNQLTITDQFGKLVYENSSLNNYDTFQIDTDNWNDGIYFITLKNSEETINQKIVKQSLR